MACTLLLTNTHGKQSWTFIKVCQKVKTDGSDWNVLLKLSPEDISNLLYSVETFVYH